MPNEENLKMFTSEYQPTGEAKSAGWKRRYKLNDYILKYSKLTLKAFKELQQELKDKPDEFTMEQVAAISYVSNTPKNFRYMKDNRDRNEGMATQKLQHIGSVESDPIQINLNTNGKEIDN